LISGKISPLFFLVNQFYKFSTSSRSSRIQTNSKNLHRRILAEKTIRTLMNLNTSIMFCFAQFSVQYFHSFQAPQAPSSGMFRDDTSSTHDNSPRRVAPLAAALSVPFAGFARSKNFFSGSTKNSLNFAKNRSEFKKRDCNSKLKEL
jgi:hypothetical protein